MGQTPSKILPETSGWDAEADEHPRIKWLYRILMGLGALLGIVLGIGVYLYYTPVMLTEYFENEITIEYGVQRYKYWRYKKRIRSGYETHRTSNGNIIFRRRLKNNQFHGMEESWYPSGKIQNRCCWVKGLKDGLDQYWHPNGQLSYEVTWDNGNQKITPKQWDETGKEIPQPETLTIDIGNGIQLELVQVPAGEFLMGTNDGNGSEKPIHKVKISKPFFMGKYEVTQEQYAKVMRTNLYCFSGVKNPVYRVSWIDAQEFCKRLSQETGYTISLPTEAQWEYACRAGSAGKWSFGDDENQLRDYAWYVNNNALGPRPIGTKKPNAFGLYDMHGNIFEWCQDWFDCYENSPSTDPIGPITDQFRFRVLRGGGYDFKAGGCRSAYRSYNDPNHRDIGIGFRIIALRWDE